MSKCRFIAVDLETTGLRIHCDQILQVGLVAFDKGGIVAEESYYIDYYEIESGEPYALAMNSAVLTKIADGEGYAWGTVDEWISDFLEEYCEPKPIPVGFNVGPFDIAMLNFHSEYEGRFHHRCIELGTALAHEDGMPMTSNQASKKYLDKTVSHDALEDARDAANLYIGRLNGKW